MKKFFSILCYVILAPFYKDFWEDEEAFTAYFGCIIGGIFLVFWFTIAWFLLYGLYLGVKYLETLI